MATWTDGPEYAPTQRPEVFVEPDLTGVPDLSAARSLDAAAAPPTPDPAQPHGSRPDFDAPDAAPLDGVAAPAPRDRDPHEAFQVASTPMSSWSSRSLPPPEGPPVPLAPPEGTPSAWGHAHAPTGTGRADGPVPGWGPEQPFPPGGPPAPHHVPGPPQAWPPAQVNPDGFPQPGPPPWQQPVEPPLTFEPVSVQSIARNTTPGVLICLAVGALVHPLSLAMLVVASVLAVRVRYRRRLVGRLFSWGMLGAFTLGFLLQFVDVGFFDAITWYDNATSFAQLANGILFVVVPLVVGDAMRRREPPEGGL